MWAVRAFGLGLVLAGFSFPSLISSSVLAKGGAKAKKRGDPAVVSPVDAAETPAVRYGTLDKDACEAELGRRRIPFATEPEVRGVLAPVRLTGAVGGVDFRSPLSEQKRKTASIEIFDCRLVLALDDFAAILKHYDVASVVHLSAYRSPSRRFPDGKVGSRHQGGLALDAATFVRSDGSKLSVDRDFFGAIGAKTCGENAGPRRRTPESTALRGIVCDAASAHLFNVQLTPNYNRRHKNHFHLEVTPNARWFLVR